MNEYLDNGMEKEILSGGCVIDYNNRTMKNFISEYIDSILLLFLCIVSVAYAVIFMRRDNMKIIDMNVNK